MGVAVMTRHIGKQAVVIGAGIAGLAAAGAIADHFERVIVLERDNLPMEAAPRPGAPQSWHLHGLLGGGSYALDQLFRGLGDDMVRAGAVPLRLNCDLREEYPGFGAIPQRDFGWLGYSLSRGLIELTMRRRLMQRANIALRQRCRVLDIVAAPSGRSVVAVRCTDVDDGHCDTLPAELVIDASGRGSLTVALLETIGQPLPEETVVGIDLGYATGIVDIPEDSPSDWKGILTHPSAPDSGRRSVMLPIEGNRWMVTMAGRKDDRPPGKWEAFLDFARGLSTPTVFNAIRNADPPSKLMRFGFPESAWRHFEQVAAFPDGLLPIGDAICRFNPVYGQGMTVASQEALCLQRLLQVRANEKDPLVGLGPAFLAKIQPLIETPWMMAAVPDFVYPDTRGERPADLQRQLQFATALRRIAIRDEVFHRLIVEVWHLLKPSSVYHDPGIARLVAEEMADA
jgi:2-polyprenyl-6-methoxyphenol hydroxylase-like FAD-dependent oxidoreductase